MSSLTTIVKKEALFTFTVFVSKPIEDITKVVGKLFNVIENSPLSSETTPLEVPFSTTFMYGNPSPDTSVTFPLTVWATIVNGNNNNKENSKNFCKFFCFI